MPAFALGRNAGFPVSYPGGFRVTCGLGIYRAANLLIDFGFVTGDWPVS